MSHLLITHFKKLGYTKIHSAEKKIALAFSVDSENLWQLASEELIMHEHQLSNWKDSGLAVHSSRERCVKLMYSCPAAIFRRVYYMSGIVLWVLHELPFLKSTQNPSKTGLIIPTTQMRKQRPKYTT